MKNRFLAFLPLAFLALFHPVLALAQQTPQPTAPPPYYMPYWHGSGHMWGGSGFGWGGPLMMLGFIALCIVIIFLLGRRSGCGWHHHHHRGPWYMRGGSAGPDAMGDPTYSALQILNERFARGEIQKPEYDEKKAAILSSGPR